MLDRNRRIKPKPERFQACDEKFDVVVSCEERVYDQVIEGNMLYLTVKLSDAAIFFYFFFSIAVSSDKKKKKSILL